MYTHIMFVEDLT